MNETVIEDRLRATKDYREWRAATVGSNPPAIPGALHRAITTYGDARAALALTTATKGLASASRAQGLVAACYQAVVEEFALLTQQEGIQ